MTDQLPELPGESRSSDERTTLLQSLDYYRAVLLRKAWGLSADRLAVRLGPSEMTLGGLLVHMAKVEHNWFVLGVAGEPQGEPWASAPWDADPDWDFHVAAQWTPAEIINRFETAIEQSRTAVEATSSLDHIAAFPDGDGNEISLRWILVHMVAEYAQHCGHADLIRESIDGRSGD